MKNIKIFIDKIKNNIQIRYFLLLLIVCVSLIGIFRPIIQEKLDISPVNNNTQSKKDLPIYCVNTDEKKVGISFDAAWGADDTDELLEILEKNNVRATFFLCGHWIDKYPEEVKKIHSKGHEIGNHSNTHPHVSKISLEENKKEILGVHEKIKNLLGIDIDLYRAPFGEYNDTVLKAARELGYHTIQWDIDSLDWKEYGVSHQVNQVLNNKHLGNGSIILFHNDAKYTPDSLDEILKGLKAKGYEIVPIGELIYKENYYMNHEGRQFLKENTETNN